jgi:hypothetical protein
MELGEERNKKLKTYAKAVLDQDQERRMKAKFRNTSYEPWKNNMAKTKDTPFGNFQDEKRKADFDFKKPQKEYIPEQGSLGVSRCPCLTSDSGGCQKEASPRQRNQNDASEHKSIWQASGSSTDTDEASTYSSIESTRIL